MYTYIIYDLIWNNNNINIILVKINDYLCILFVLAIYLFS
jgi:hypothetical protein